LATDTTANVSGTGTTTTASTTADKTATREPEIINHKSKYKVTSFSLIDPNIKDPIVLLPESINKITIIQDFENCVQPVIKLEVVFPPLIVDYISQHKGEISFFLRVQLINYASAQNNFQMEGNYPVTATDDICNGKFIMFTEESSQMPNKALYESVSRTITGDEKKTIDDITKCGENLINYTKEYGFFIWKEDDLYNLRKPINAVYSNCTVGDAANHIVSDQGFTRVLMSPPNNTKSYDQLVIPPMTTMSVFNFLQDQYGMYDTDVTFFCDIYRTYILDKSGECTAYTNDQYRKMIFSVTHTTSEGAMGVGTSTLEEKKEYHGLLDIEDVQQRSLTALWDVTHGTVNQMTDARNNETTTVKGAGSQRGDGCVNITTDNEGTPYTKNRLTNSVAEMKLNLKITHMSDYDYTAITPNLAFVFEFKDKDYYIFDGYFRLMTAKHFLMRQGTEMAIVGEFEFTRKKGLTEEEKETIEYDVFRTAKKTDEGVAAAAAKNSDTSETKGQNSEKVADAQGKVDQATKEQTAAQSSYDTASAKYETAAAATGEARKGYAEGTVTEDEVNQKAAVQEAASLEKGKAYENLLTKQDNLAKAQANLAAASGTTTVSGSDAPTPVVDATPASSASQDMPFSMSSDAGYQAQVAKEKAAATPTSTGGGSPAPTPLDEKGGSFGTTTATDVANGINHFA
jgi:hypothetical protein